MSIDTVIDGVCVHACAHIYKYTYIGLMYIKYFIYVYIKLNL